MAVVVSGDLVFSAGMKLAASLFNGVISLATLLSYIDCDKSSLDVAAVHHHVNSGRCPWVLARRHGWENVVR